MAEKITTQIINQFAAGSEVSDTQQEILNQLSREYRYPIKIQSNEEKWLTFKVPDGESKDGDQNLSPEETGKLKKKLFEVTQSIVYNNLTGGLADTS